MSDDVQFVSGYNAGYRDAVAESDGWIQEAIDNERARIRREQAAVIAEIRAAYGRYGNLPTKIEWADRLEEVTRDE